MMLIRNISWQLYVQSSKDGDKFIGAGGSTLIIDALEVVGE